MLKGILRYIKVIANHLAIAFLFVSFIIFFIFVIFGKNIDKNITLINKMFVFNNTYKKREKSIVMDKIEKKLSEYPSIGEVFGSVSIPSINVDITLYHGESLRILKYGLGHHAGSYFPGEGGTIIIAGHNSYGVLYDLPKVNMNDKVIIKTTYGTYTYVVYDTSIVYASDLNNDLTLSKDKEILMLYTCYPTDTPGYKSKRFVLLAELEEE